MPITLLGCGSDAHGQLGSGLPDCLVPTPCRAIDSLHARHEAILACGPNHTALLLDDPLASTNLLTAGRNHRGQGCRATDADAIGFERADAVVSGKRFERVACGWDFTLLLDADGVLWSCGEDGSGQLGRRVTGDDVEAGRSFVPGVVKLPAKVLKMAAGVRHAMAVLENGEVWGWGDVKSGGLGPVEVCEDIAAWCRGLVSEDARERVTELMQQYARRQLDLSSLLTRLEPLLSPTIDRPQLRARLSSCPSAPPAYHTSHSSLVTLPIRILAAPFPCHDVACGRNHTVLIGIDYGDHHACVTLGRNRWGQLGDPTVAQDSSDAPHVGKVRIRPDGITDAAVQAGEGLAVALAGWSHSGVVTSAGRVLLWGRADKGQLGSGSPEASVTCVAEPAECVPLRGAVKVALASESGLAGKLSMFTPALGMLVFLPKLCDVK
ncbi:hypothetical protein HK101_001386 [Irineochytrium annulatum]|nr:hypothetical protein HK101_001386 [Irineochytrium annulatum]